MFAITLHVHMSCTLSNIDHASLMSKLLFSEVIIEFQGRSKVKISHSFMYYLLIENIAQLGQQNIR